MPVVEPDATVDVAATREPESAEQAVVLSGSEVRRLEAAAGDGGAFVLSARDRARVQRPGRTEEHGTRRSQGTYPTR